jgi:fucose 4-O-acetylase-like acetyltransferase
MPLMQSQLAQEPSAAAAARAAPPVEWVNYAKGLGIVLVVFGHVEAASKFLESPGEARWLGIIETAIYQFHMPLFFFLSGLFVAKSARRPAWEFLTHKARTILYPYVVWTILQAAMASLAPQAATRPIHFWDVVKQLPYHPYAQFWFLYVLFMCMTAFLVLHKLGFGTLAITVVALSFYAMGAWVTLPNWGMLFQFRAEFGYFMLGALFCPVILEGINKYPLRWLLAAAIWLYGLVLWSAIAKPGPAAINDITLLGGAGIMATVALAKALSAFPGTGLVAFLGEKSLVIYVAHVVFGAMTRTGLLKVHITNLWIHLAAACIAGLVLPILLDQAARRLRFKYLFSA